MPVATARGWAYEDEEVEYLVMDPGQQAVYRLRLTGSLSQGGGPGATTILCRASSGILEPGPGQQQYYAAPRRVGGRSKTPLDPGLRGSWAMPTRSKKFG